MPLPKSSVPPAAERLSRSPPPASAASGVVAASSLPPMHAGSSAVTAPAARRRAPPPPPSHRAPLHAAPAPTAPAPSQQTLPEAAAPTTTSSPAPSPALHEVHSSSAPPASLHELPALPLAATSPQQRLRALSSASSVSSPLLAVGPLASTRTRSPSSASSTALLTARARSPSFALRHSSGGGGGSGGSGGARSGSGSSPTQSYLAATAAAAAAHVESASNDPDALRAVIAEQESKLVTLVTLRSQLEPLLGLSPSAAATFMEASAAITVASEALKMLRTQLERLAPGSSAAGGAALERLAPGGSAGTAGGTGPPAPQQGASAVAVGHQATAFRRLLTALERVEPSPVGVKGAGADAVPVLSSVAGSRQPEPGNSSSDEPLVRSSPLPAPAARALPAAAVVVVTAARGPSPPSPASRRKPSTGRPLSPVPEALSPQQNSSPERVARPADGAATGGDSNAWRFSSPGGAEEEAKSSVAEGTSAACGPGEPGNRPGPPHTVESDDDDDDTATCSVRSGAASGPSPTAPTHHARSLTARKSPPNTALPPLPRLVIAAAAEAPATSLSPPPDLATGDLLHWRVALVEGACGTVRFVGPTAFAKGEWVGLELELPSGSSDGSVEGRVYFACEANVARGARHGTAAALPFGTFVRRHRIARLLAHQPPLAVGAPGSAGAPALGAVAGGDDSAPGGDVFAAATAAPAANSGRRAGGSSGNVTSRSLARAASGGSLGSSSRGAVAGAVSGSAAAAAAAPAAAPGSVVLVTLPSSPVGSVAGSIGSSVQPAAPPPLVLASAASSSGVRPRLPSRGAVLPRASKPASTGASAATAKPRPGDIGYISVAIARDKAAASAQPHKKPLVPRRRNSLGASGASQSAAASVNTSAATGDRAPTLLDDSASSGMPPPQPPPQPNRGGWNGSTKLPLRPVLEKVSSLNTPLLAEEGTVAADATARPTRAPSPPTSATAESALSLTDDGPHEASAGGTGGGRHLLRGGSLSSLQHHLSISELVADLAREARHEAAALADGSAGGASAATPPPVLEEVAMATGGGEAVTAASATVEAPSDSQQRPGARRPTRDGLPRSQQQQQQQQRARSTPAVATGDGANPVGSVGPPAATRSASFSASAAAASTPLRSVGSTGSASTATRIPRPFTTVTTRPPPGSESPPLAGQAASSSTGGFPVGRGSGDGDGQRPFVISPVHALPPSSVASEDVGCETETAASSSRARRGFTSPQPPSPDHAPPTAGRAGPVSPSLLPSEAEAEAVDPRVADSPAPEGAGSATRRRRASPIKPPIPHFPHPPIAAALRGAASPEAPPRRARATAAGHVASPQLPPAPRPAPPLQRVMEGPYGLPILTDGALVRLPPSIIAAAAAKAATSAAMTAAPHAAPSSKPASPGTAAAPVGSARSGGDGGKRPFKPDLRAAAAALRRARARASHQRTGDAAVAAAAAAVLARARLALSSSGAGVEGTGEDDGESGNLPPPPENISSLPLLPASASKKSLWDGDGSSPLRLRALSTASSAVEPPPPPPPPAAVGGPAHMLSSPPSLAHFSRLNAALGLLVAPEAAVTDAPPLPTISLASSSKVTPATAVKIVATPLAGPAGVEHDGSAARQLLPDFSGGGEFSGHDSGDVDSEALAALLEAAALDKHLADVTGVTDAATRAPAVVETTVSQSPAASTRVPLPPRVLSPGASLSRPLSAALSEDAADWLMALGLWRHAGAFAAGGLTDMRRIARVGPALLLGALALPPDDAAVVMTALGRASELRSVVMAVS